MSIDKIKQVCYNIITVKGKNPKRKELIIMKNWIKKYKVCKAIGVKHPFTASFKKNYLGVKSL